MDHSARASLLLFIFVLIFSVWGLGTIPTTAQSVQSEGGAYRVYYERLDRLSALARDYDIWEVNRREGYAILALSAEDTATLRSEGLRMVPAIQHTQRWSEGPPAYDCYRDVDELYVLMQGLAATYPNLVQLLDYGDSWRKVRGTDGYDLWVLRITNLDIQIPKPRFFLMANIHARELTTPETALFFVKHLLDNYGTDADATWILDYHEVYVVVTANPDGRALAEDGCYQRKNRNDLRGDCQVCDLWGSSQFGVDLNRNNPYRWGGAGTDPCGLTFQGISPASEPETYFLNDLVRSIFPDQRHGDDAAAPKDTSGLLISLHSYGNLVLWPWGWTASPTQNAAALQTLGRKFAYLNQYEPGQASTGLYHTTGDTTDWAYGELGIPAYTFELGEFFFQPCGDLQQIMEENLGPLVYAAKVPRNPYITPAGPDSLDISALPAMATPGTSVLLKATIDDTRYNNRTGVEPTQAIAAAAYYVDVPPWITATEPITHPMSAIDGSFDEPIEESEAVIDTADLAPGQHTIFVRGQDADGNWGAFSAVYLVIEEPLACTEASSVELTLETNDPILAGDTVTLRADIAPEDAKPYVYAIDYGDGTTPVTGTSSQDPLVLHHAYTSTGTYFIELSIWTCEMADPVTGMHEITIHGKDHRIYLPTITRIP